MTALRAPSLLAICLMSVSLAACGGGGGGGGGSSSGSGGGSSSDGGSSSGGGSGSAGDSSQSFGDLPARRGLVQSGQVVNNITDLDNPPTATGGSAVRIGFDDDGSPAIVGVRVVDSDGNEIRTFVLDRDDIVNTDGRIVAFEEGTQSAIVIDPDDADYDYQRFGIWAEEDDDVASAAAFSAGAAAPDDATPTGTYEGDSIGIQTIYDNPSSGVAYTGTRSDVTITVQGNDAQFTTSNTRLVGRDGSSLRSQPDLNLNGNLDVGSGAISGNVSGATTTGEAAGRFFGPDAEEVGGTFETNSANGTYVGAFGAERDD